MPRTYRLISGDSHLEIPCDWWTPWVPAKYRDRAPRRIKLPDGGDAYLGEGVTGGTEHYAGHTPENFNPMLPVNLDEVPGSGPPSQRLAEQDADHTDAELLYPSSSAMKGCRGIKNDDAYRAVIRAYNSYLAAPTTRPGCWASACSLVAGLMATSRRWPTARRSGFLRWSSAATQAAAPIRPR